VLFGIITAVAHKDSGKAAERLVSRLPAQPELPGFNSNVYPAY